MSSLTDTVEVQRETYRRLVLRKRLILAGLVVLLLCSVLLDLALGPASYSFSEVLGALFSPDSASPQVRVVMWDIRLPVALMAVAVGAALSLRSPWAFPLPPVSARRWAWRSVWRCSRWPRNSWCRSTPSSWPCSRRC
ncbi:iron-enterobactin transporter permease [compost metagenome]